MTAISFVRAIEGYYGAYRKAGIRVLVAKYLTKYSEDELDVLIDRVLLEYSGQYKHTPDIAIFQKTAQGINKEVHGWIKDKQVLQIAEEGRVTNEEGLKFIRDLLRKLSKKKTLRGKV